MKYKGGKNGEGVYQTIISQMPPHNVYIEPFFGSGAVISFKKPAAASFANDIDRDAVTRFLVDGFHIENLRMSNECAIEYLKGKYFLTSQKTTLIYLDPPYLKSVRSSKQKLYKHEFWTNKEHTSLLNLINTFDCMVVLSGYPSDLYSEMLTKEKGWRVVEFESRLHTGKSRTEYLWCNFTKPKALHDYRYLGKDYRQREMYAKREKTLQNRFSRMSSLEKHRFLEYVEKLKSEFLDR